MPDTISLDYTVDGTDFASAGSASSDVKQTLKRLGFDAQTIKKVAICMYEGEINMVIHADGGTARVLISSSEVSITLADSGPGIPNLDLAMQEGYSTATEEARNLGFGAGMGLPNMKKFSDEMSVDTTLGVGTTVHMRIFARRP